MIMKSWFFRINRAEQVINGCFLTFLATISSITEITVDQISCLMDGNLISMISTLTALCLIKYNHNNCSVASMVRKRPFDIYGGQKFTAKQIFLSGIPDRWFALVLFRCFDSSLAIYMSPGFSSQCCRLGHQRLCHVFSRLCNNACKRSLGICHNNRASCPNIASMCWTGILIWSNKKRPVDNKDGGGLHRSMRFC